ncbi:MAG: Tyrosine-specific transport protein [Chlamydiae bacterium]|nr:Tyrosine-specific transport protein [Chlamydiota bacterium]
MAKGGTLLGGSLLVAGTCIGGGMLALPVLTSLGGFVPSLVIYFFCWLFMASTGLLFLEVCHWMEGESNIVSMAEKTLGKKGKMAAWVVYLFLFYCLTLAYVVGCGNLVTQVLPIPQWAGSAVFVMIFAPFVFAGTRVVGRLNLFLMLGLGLSYIAFIILGYPFVKTEFLTERDWSLSLFALPVAFTSFGFQGIIPTLSSYMQKDVKKTALAILIGSFIPLITYVIWEWLILGIVPTYGEGGLSQALHNGDNAIQPLKSFINNPRVYILGQYFAFFALTTSFFGVTLGLLDFMADGLKIKKNNRGKLLLSFLVFVPPLILACVNPNVFLVALDVAGGFGCALLLGLLPVLMVWSGRYHLKLPSSISLPGGKTLLALLVAFVLFVVCFEIKHLFLS